MIFSDLRGRSSASPQRHVQSLPRPSLGNRLEVCHVTACHVTIPETIPKRSASFHVKSNSLSHPPVSPLRKSSLDICDSPVFRKTPEPEKYRGSENTTQFFPPPSPIPLTSTSSCGQLRSVSLTPRLPSLSDSDSENEDQNLEEKLEIISDSESGTTMSTTRKLSTVSEQRSSTQSAPGNLQSSPDSIHRKSSLSPRNSGSNQSGSSYSNRIKQLRSRPALETEGVVTPGRVAAILHRFSSTNRGSIRSVYYDSDSEEETGSQNRKSNQSQFSEVDHLSQMLDETLEDLPNSG